MFWVFLIVLIVMLLMNSLIFVALRNLTTRVGGQIHQHAARQLNVYDELLDSKSDELHLLEARLARARSQSIGAIGASASSCCEPRHREIVLPLAAAAYRSNDFCDDYLQVKKHFKVNFEQAIAMLPPDNDKARCQLLQQLEAHLNFDVRYRLLALDSQMQLALLEQVLPATELEVVHNYLAHYNEFKILEFCDWISSEIWENSETIQVYSGDTADMVLSSGLPIELHEDSKTCEGFSVVYKGRLYDYSIQKRELI